MSPEQKERSALCVGIGEVVWDRLPAGRALGGAPVNVTAHAVRQGVRGALVSAVGDDEDGREVLRRLSALGVDASAVQVHPGWPTGSVDVTLNAAGVPTFEICAPAAWDGIEMTDGLAALAARADAVVFGSLAQRNEGSRACIQSFLRHAPARCIKVFDVNLRAPWYDRGVLLDSLALSTVVKLNESELPVLGDLLGLRGDETAQLQALRDRFALDAVVYTMGPRGSRILAAAFDAAHPEVDAEIVDTVGAGDAFTATVTTGLLKGLDLATIQAEANRVAAVVCSHAGALPPSSSPRTAAPTWRGGGPTQ